MTFERVGRRLDPKEKYVARANRALTDLARWLKFEIDSAGIAVDYVDTLVKERRNIFQRARRKAPRRLPRKA